MTFFRSAVVLLLSVCWASAAHAQPSAQDIETARQLYNEGLSLRDEGDMEGALEKFRAAHALGNTPLTGIELCRAHAALRQPVEAREACLAVGRIPFMRQETSRSKNARQEAARIAEVERGKIGSLRVKIMGVPVGREATVTIDGALVPPEALDAPRALNPGVHVITARVDDGPEARATVETAEGEVREIEIVVQPPEEPAPPAPPEAMPEMGVAPPDPPKRNRTVAIVSFTVAGVSAAAGSVAGLIAAVGEGELSLRCEGKICGPDSSERLQSARQWGDVSTALFLVAGLGLATGLVAMLVPTSRSSPRPASTAGSAVRVAPVLGLGGAGLHGSF